MVVVTLPHYAGAYDLEKITFRTGTSFDVVDEKLVVNDNQKNQNIAIFRDWVYAEVRDDPEGQAVPYH